MSRFSKVGCAPILGIKFSVSLSRKITVLSEKRCSDFSICIRFRSGKLEQLFLKKPLPCADRKRHTDDTIALIRELTSSMDDHEIANRLNMDGLTTPEGKSFTYAGVRYKHAISGPYKRNHRGITVAEAASLLGISNGKLYYSIPAGKIPTKKQHPGWPWEILIDDTNLESIKTLYR